MSDVNVNKSDCAMSALNCLRLALDALTAYSVLSHYSGSKEFRLRLNDLIGEVKDCVEVVEVFPECAKVIRFLETLKESA
jgi:hypothetical protein